jgi:hypothetical protein
LGNNPNPIPTTNTGGNPTSQSPVNVPLGIPENYPGQNRVPQ